VNLVGSEDLFVTNDNDLVLDGDVSIIEILIVFDSTVVGVNEFSGNVARCRVTIERWNSTRIT
jgi:hypothetical protein